MSELLNCPCCNSEARTFRRKGVTGKVCRSEWYRERTACTNEKCGLTTIEHKRPGLSAKAWNTRVEAAA